jgi:unsaturated chondroitin disaccharide hydrolase
MNIDTTLTPADLVKPIERVFALAGDKSRAIEKSWDTSRGTPVFTVEGKYTTRGWTEWTEGFLYGNALLTFDKTGEKDLLDLARRKIDAKMASHVSHTGVHDHGFNNLSTYGNLRRLIKEGKVAADDGEMKYLELALKISGATQASRWQGVRVDKPSPHSANAAGLGYIYSFNGPHSLFVDTMRTIRILGVAWQLGHKLMHEGDRAADLLKRSVLHGLTTSQYVVFHGDGGHTYDVRGRTCHEAVFNRNDGAFRCRSTQQGYSPFSTWTRGLAWAMLGYAEELEFFQTIDAAAFEQSVGLTKAAVMEVYTRCAVDTCDHYLNEASCADGIPYWDDGAPGLCKLPDWQAKPADLGQDHEPVDASASAIAAQGLIRLGRFLGADGVKYLSAGLAITKVLTAEPYLAVDEQHQGLLLHSVYHWPNGWDYVPAGRRVPFGESSMWGDYHLLELCTLVAKLNRGKYMTFFDA